MLVLPPLTPQATWSVAIRDAATGTLLATHSPTTVLRTASVGKIFLLLEAARGLAAGDLDADEPLAWTDEDYVEDSGLWFSLRARTLPLADVCALVGAVSDNLATNVLVRRLGIDAARARAREFGCTDSRMLDRVRSERLPGMPPTLSLGRADELSDVMGRLHRGAAQGDDPCARVLGWLGANTDLSMVAAAFDLDPLAHAEPDRGVHLVNKTGTIATVRADVGIVHTDAVALAYAVLAGWEEGTDPRGAVLADMRAIGSALRTELGAAST